MSVRFERGPRKAGSGEMSNASTYAENAIAFCRRAGRAEGTNPVISSDGPGWSLWMEYFEHIGHAHGRPNSYARQVGRLTVPARSPDEFEPGWRASAPVDPVAPVASHRQAKSETASPAEKARVQEQYERIMRELYSAKVTGAPKEKPPLPPLPVQDDAPVTISAKLNDYLNSYSALSKEF